MRLGRPGNETGEGLGMRMNEDVLEEPLKQAVLSSLDSQKSAAFIAALVQLMTQANIS